MQGSAVVSLCQLDRGFYGIGCSHLGVECLIAQNHQAPGSLRMLIRYRDPDASHYGASSHGVGHLIAATSRVLVAVQKMDHKHLVKVHMGKGG